MALKSTKTISSGDTGGIKQREKAIGKRDKQIDGIDNED
jgi:hypothetical protein